MAASELEEDAVRLKCINSQSAAEEIAKQEILISTANICDWDSPSILAFPTVIVQANRSRLIEESSYFRGLLSGSFSDSCLEFISIHWDLETFINLLKFIYCCPLNITSSNFLSIFEGALFFGVEKLLLKCKAWFAEITSARVSSLELQLDDLIHIWKFCVEHANGSVVELCTSYLARNFMWAMSSKSFCSVPYDLLYSCLLHPHLTVDSEKDLCAALVVWIDMKRDCLADCYIDLLNKVRKSLLPLWFAMGKRNHSFFSQFADESTNSIFSLTVHSSMDSNDLEYDDLHHLRIRLTEYSKRVDLSSCPQITTAVLLLSVLPSWYAKEPALRSIFQFQLNIRQLWRDQHSVSKGLLSITSFAAVQEVEISKCPRLNLEGAIGILCKSFPSLRILRASHTLSFRTQILRELVQKFPQLVEVDLTVDISPMVRTEVSFVSSSSSELAHCSKMHARLEDCHIELESFSVTTHVMPILTRLTLEGRSDVSDSDLQAVSELGVSLCYLNLKGCFSVTDLGISGLIKRCRKLHSILVCDTSFGRNSALALCSDISYCGGFPDEQFEKKHVNSMACKLQALHIGGCKGVDETSLQELMSLMHMLKTLCLRETHLVDSALCSLSCTSLEVLNVSNTEVSGAALAQVVNKNYALKCLRARGCKNLSQYKSSDVCLAETCKELDFALGKTCKLEEITMGWGWSCFSLETLKPAIASLKSITVGLGASLGQESLALLPTTCPLLESVILYFQVISDGIIIKFVESLRCLQELALCYCLGDVSSFSFQLSMPNLRKLKLERVTSWMTNEDLVTLTRNCTNLVELSLVGCVLLNPDSQRIISRGWPGLISLSLEDCGEITENGVDALFDCKALEDVLLRHNGLGIQRNFILDAAVKMPLLRKISLDLCDACDGGFDLPNGTRRYFLSTVKIARCKRGKCGIDLLILEAHRRPVHKETLVLLWDSKNLTRTVVRERL